jgi:hypothetical protein
MPSMDMIKFHQEIQSGLRYPMSDRLRGGQLKASAAPAAPSTRAKSAAPALRVVQSSPRAAAPRAERREPPERQDSYGADDNAGELGERVTALEKRVDKLEGKDVADNGEKKAKGTRASAPTQADCDALRRKVARLQKEQDERRGSSKSTSSRSSGPALLTGRDREEMDRAMGLATVSAKGPGLGADGTFTLGTETPSQLRARLARQARIGAGKVA